MDREKKKKLGFLKYNSYFDYTLLFLTLFLLCFGLVMIYSSSSYVSQRSEDFNNDAAFFLKKQLFAATIGIGVMFVASKVDYRIFRKKINIPVLNKFNILSWIFIISFILQVYVLFFGEELNGKKRWIRLGSITFQPSDISKFAVILVVAYLIYKAPRKLDKISGFFAILILMLPMIYAIVKANLSTAIIVVAIIGVMCFVASRKNKYFFVLGGLGGLGIYIYIKYLTTGYRGERFQIWREVETHEKGYQIRQGLYAIASGGLTGTGLGKSMQKLGYIPEAQNDMIFTVICEELGLLGAIVTMFLFLMLLYRIYIITINAPDLFGSMICVGVMIQIAVQVIINVAVVTNVLPSTGIALPFISYGGTSLMILMGEIGVVLSISNQIRHTK